MPAFQNRFSALQTFREHQRDRCRQELALALAGESDLVRQEQELDEARVAQLLEMSERLTPGRVDIDGSASRRYHAGQLQLQIRQLAQRKELARRRVEVCRRALIQADQQVQALEKLHDRERQEYEQAQVRRVAKEREENWLARRLQGDGF